IASSTRRSRSSSARVIGPKTNFHIGTRANRKMTRVQKPAPTVNSNGLKPPSSVAAASSAGLVIGAVPPDSAGLRGRTGRRGGSAGLRAGGERQQQADDDAEEGDAFDERGEQQRVGADRL